MAWIVVAATSVPSISTFVAAIPVGAAAFAFLPLTMHHRYTVVSKKDLPLYIQIANRYTITRD
jgi:hypothetical protein